MPSTKTSESSPFKEAYISSSMKNDSKENPTLQNPDMSINENLVRFACVRHRVRILKWDDYFSTQILSMN